MGCPNYTNSTLILLHYPETTCTMTEPLQKNFPSGVKCVKFPPDINMLSKKAGRSHFLVQNRGTYLLVLKFL